MGKEKPWTRQTVLKAIKGSGGLVTVIAKRLGGCSWGTAKKYIDKWPSTKVAFHEEDETILDLCENTLIQSIRGVSEKEAAEKGTRPKDPDMGNLRFYLQTKGRRRGYGNTMEISGQIELPTTQIGVQGKPLSPDES